MYTHDCVNVFHNIGYDILHVYISVYNLLIFFRQILHLTRIKNKDKGSGDDHKNLWIGLGIGGVLLFFQEKGPTSSI